MPTLISRVCRLGLWPAFYSKQTTVFGYSSAPAVHIAAVHRVFEGLSVRLQRSNAHAIRRLARDAVGYPVLPQKIQYVLPPAPPAVAEPQEQAQQIQAGPPAVEGPAQPVQEVEAGTLGTQWS